MTLAPRFVLLVISLALVGGVPAVSADDKKPLHSAVKPDQRKDKFAMQRHEAFVQRAQKGDVDVLFLGDSITQGWEGQKDVWDSHFAALKPANFGIGGDRTQHVLCTCCGGSRRVRNWKASSPTWWS